MAWNVTGLSTNVALGGTQIYKEADIILFTETWEYTGNALPLLAGFECIGSIFNERRFNRGRGFGGVAIYARNHLQGLVEIEHKDNNNQFLVLKLKTKGTPSFLLAAYFAPLDMSIYTMGGANRLNPFHDLIQSIHRLQDQGEIWLVGDFNARIRGEQFLSAQELGVPWSLQTEEEGNWSRQAVDLKSNEMSTHFLRLGAACGLRILNGIERFPHSSGFTFSSVQGSSTVDYLLATPTSTTIVTDFRILPQQPESHHLPLLFHLKLAFSQQGKSQQKLPAQGFFLDPEKKDIFRAQVEEGITTSTNGRDLAQVLVSATSHVFSKRRPSRPQGTKSWFDEECAKAREKATSQTGEARRLACRMYSNLTKHKRRCFMRRHQQKLCEEFYEHPKLFWNRLKARKTTSCLDPESLVKYVQSLYFFPEVACMPLEGGDTIQFTQEEVQAQLARMKTGKAIDLDGLSVELLQCLQLLPKP